jgi:ketosteroid isomerase-like protein
MERRRSVPDADQDALQVAEAFIAAINARDLAALAKLMSEDHRFVDAAGALHVGRGPMTSGWAQYFAAFPEYRIDV